MSSFILVSPLAPCSGACGHISHLLSGGDLLCMRVSHLRFDLQVLSRSLQIALFPGKLGQWVLPRSKSGIPPRFPSLGPAPAPEAVLSGSQTPSRPLLLPLSRASLLLGLAYNTACGIGTKMTGLPPSRRGNTFIGPSVRHGD